MAQSVLLPKGMEDPRALANLPAGATLAVALSGGADSVALLLSVAPPLVAVHVHHGIRGEEADRDAEFCRRLCLARNIPFVLCRADVPARAKRLHESIETAARAERYRLLFGAVRENGAAALLTAHHADDQLETVLEHILRGSGLRGLCGIAPIREEQGVKLIRPMLGVCRSDILRFLADQGQTYVTDSTNAEKQCLRNRLRLDVVPGLLEIAPDAAAKIASMTRTLREDENFLAETAEHFLSEYQNAPPAAELARLPYPVFVRVIGKRIPRDLGSVHYAALREFAARGVPHSRLSLPHTQARIENGLLLFGRPGAAPPVSYRVDLQKGENLIKNAEAAVYLGDLSCNIQNDPKKLYKYATSVSFLSDKVKGSLYVRNRREGDRILQGGVHKAVRRLEGLRPLSPEVRRRMPLLCDEEGILAVPFCPLRDGAAKKGENDLTVRFYFN